MIKEKIYKLKENIIKHYLIIKKGRNNAYSFSYYPYIRLLNKNKIYWKNKFLFETHSFDELNSNEKDIFIIGSGPSINRQNLALLKNKKVIFLNGSIIIAKKYNIPPFCLTIMDSTFVINRQNIIKEIPSKIPLILSLSVIKAFYYFMPQILKEHPIFLIENPLEPYNGTKKEIIDLDKKYFYISKAGDSAFSLNPSKGLYNGGTVMSNAIQLAFYAGFKRVFLLGLDIGNANQPRFYETNNNKIKCGLLNDYETEILPFMKATRELAEIKGISIYNCSPITKLPYEVIPYFNFKTFEEENNVN